MEEIKTIIIDTDLGADCDDCVALALAISLHKEKRLKLDAITLSTTREYAPNALSAMLDYCGFDCPVGQMTKPAIEADEFDYYCHIYKDYENNRKIEDAVRLLRSKMAECKNKIIIAAIGPYTNIARLIESKGDEISPLTGLELINNKVEAIYLMGCSSDNKFAEWNVKSDIESAKTVFNAIRDVPVYVITHECGANIKTGLPLLKEANSPFAKMIRSFFKTNKNKDNNLERESWDPITILSILDSKEMFGEKKGIISIRDDGTAAIEETTGNHHMLEVEKPEAVKTYINNQIAKIITMKGEQAMKKEPNSKKEIEIKKRNDAKVKSIVFPSDTDESDKQNNYIILKNINKIYDNDVQAVFDFNLNIKKNEFIVLVGPSGCGKSTTLRMIAGLEEISGGELFINSVYSNDLAPKNRDIAMVFQTYALYPHMSVYKNLAFGLKIRKFPTLVLDKDGNKVQWIDKTAIKRINSQLKDCHYITNACQKEIIKLEKIDGEEKEIAEKKINYYNEQIKLAAEKTSELEAEREKASTTLVDKYVLKHLPKEEIDKRVNEAAKILEIEGYLNRKPRALSGGQRQRVALGRAIVRNPAAFLMDEPLSNLDAKLRVQMRSEIVNIHRAVGATTIYVTHDQTEAMTMADRIVVMKDGMVQQIGTPIDIYSHPKNLFVAQFIGAPAMNVVKATYQKDVVLFNDTTKQKMPKSNEYVVSYYQKEIERLAQIENDMDEMLKDTKHPKRHIFELAKQRCEELIMKYEAKKQELQFDVLFGIRPEDVIVADKKTASSFDVEVKMVELLGSEYFIHTIFAGNKFIFKTGNDKVVKTGDTLHIEFKADKIHLFDLDSEMTIR